MIELIFPISILILLSLIITKKPTHDFWDKQPVMKNYHSTNLFKNIGTNPIFRFKTDGLVIKKTSDISVIYNFINSNFNKYFCINSDCFSEIYNKPNSRNIGIWEKDKLIGFIHSHTIDFKYRKHDIVFEYVDYLCVDKEYRKQNIASILIGSLINSYSDKSTSFLFKKDQYRLPIKHIVQSQYYYAEIDKLKKPEGYDSNTLKIIKISLENHEIFYRYINNELDKYVFRHLYSIEEFKKLFLGGIYRLIIIENPNSEYTIIIGKDNKFKWDGKYYNTFDIDIVLGYIGSNNLVYKIKEILGEDYRYITMPDIGRNMEIMGDSFSGANKMYYYTYNYNMPKIDNIDFGFNLN